jgi:hypothetical protein
METTDLLLGYCARTLDAGTEAGLERHLLECGECRKLVNAQKAVWDALGEWEPVEVSADFDRKLFSRMEREERTPWWSYLLRPMRPFALRPALPLAAACLTLVAALVIRTPSVMDTPMQSKTEKVDIEQVERTLDDLEMLTQFSPVPAAEAPVSHSSM